MKKKLPQRVIILTHTQYRNDKQVPGPSDVLADFFLNTRIAKFIFVQHSIFQGNGSVVDFYSKGKKTKSIKTSFQVNFPNPIRYITDLFVTLNAFTNEKKFTVAVAADPLNYAYAYFLKKLNKVNKIYFYTLDYSRDRFSNPILNEIYHFLDRFAVNSCDLSISACKKICDVRKAQGLAKNKNLYLPNSPILEGVQIKNTSEINKHELVMVFSDPALIDFKIIFQAISKLSRKYKDIGLKLIGRGDFKNKLIKPAQKYQILKRIKFLDTPTHKDTLEEISTSAIGLECNNETLPWNEYREPIKIREYFALGLPLISKPGHALIDEVNQNKLGFIVTNVPEFVEAVGYFFDHPKIYQQFRDKALKHSKKFDKQKNIKKIFQ